jgi:hypothetical protein
VRLRCPVVSAAAAHSPHNILLNMRSAAAPALPFLSHARVNSTPGLPPVEQSRLPFLLLHLPPPHSAFALSSTPPPPIATAAAQSHPHLCLRAARGWNTVNTNSQLGLGARGTGTMQTYRNYPAQNQRSPQATRRGAPGGECSQTALFPSIVPAS